MRYLYSFGGWFSRSVMSDSCNPLTETCQAPLSMGFSRQEYWSGLPFPSRGDLPNPGIKPRFLALKADSLLTELPGKHLKPNQLLYLVASAFDSRLSFVLHGNITIVSKQYFHRENHSLFLIQLHGNQLRHQFLLGCLKSSIGYLHYSLQKNPNILLSQPNINLEKTYSWDFVT